jgi:transglutaminase-like putative cysteine protease
MMRTVSSHLEIDVTTTSEMVLSMAVAATSGVFDERFEARVDGVPVDVSEITDAHGTRLHQFTADPGSLIIDYSARVEGREPAASATEIDRIRYLRPSRYCESDTLAATAAAEFGGLEGFALLEGVSSWVGTRLAYVPGSSLPTDGAVSTLLARQGVCRDYAHLCVALLRASDVPARLVSVYAPGLDPMDFHAVCEALVEGEWRVVDATTLAPRSTLVRIATGRDAADTAFMTVLSGTAELLGMTVTAVVDSLPHDDLTIPVALG